MTIKNLRDHLHSKWEKIVQRKKISVHDGDDDEAVGQALIAGSQFKGRCSFCRKIGHKASERRSNPKNKTNKGNGNNLKKKKRFGAYGSGFRGKCRHCEEIGHIERYCKHKQNGDDSGMIAGDDQGIGICL